MTASELLDVAYERLYHTGPEWGGNLANHGRFRRWWQVLGSNQRRLSRRFLLALLLVRGISPVSLLPV